MALSYDIHAGTGAATNFSVSFDYIVSSHVKVYLDGVLQTLTTDYTWFNATTIAFNVAPTAGAVILFDRDTPNTTRLVDFQDAGNLTEYDLDTSADQMFYLVQEGQDLFDDSALGLAVDGKWDADTKIMKNLVDPTADQEAATKKYVDDGDAGTIASAAAAAASAAAALVSENAAAADLVLTNADVVTTNADAAATAADLVQTALDVIICDGDATLTAADVVTTNADVLLTQADVVSTASDVVAAASYSAAANLSKLAAAASETAADVSHGYATDWAIKTSAIVNDGVDTDYSSKAYSIGSAAQNPYGSSKRWATEVEDTYVVGTDYSALHWAAKAAASAATLTDEQNRKNAIINGCFRVWDRGIAFTAVAHAAFMADRWKLLNTSAGVVFGVYKDTSAVAGVPFASALELDVTTADASVAAADHMSLTQYIEGVQVREYMFGKAAAITFNVSFWHCHTKTGTNTVSIRNSAYDRSLVYEYTQAVADTWEKTTLEIDADTAGTWLISGATVGLRLGFTVMAGTNYNAAATGTWYGANYVSTSSQVNNLDNTANYFRIAQVQVEPNAVASRFEQRDISVERLLCARYFNSSYGASVAPGTVTDVGAKRHQICATTDDFVGLNWDFPVAMMATPTVTWYEPVTGGNIKVYDLTSSTTRQCGNTNYTSDRNTGYPVANSTRADGTEFYCHYTAEAEL